MANKCIPIASVQVGMYLCGIDRSWLDTPFLKHRFLIRSSADVDKLHRCGIQEITIDTERGLDVVPDSEGTPLPKETTASIAVPLPLEQVPFVPPEHTRIPLLPNTVQGLSLSGEFSSMKHARQCMLASVQDILHTLAKTGGMAVEQVHHLIQSIMAETLGHEEACMAMIQTREFSPCLYDHALTVSTLAVLFGRSRGLQEDWLSHLAIAGLLHDAGLLMIPQSLHRPLNQLSETELGIYHTHPGRGINLISKHSTFAKEVETLIREHHIALNGCGYPSRIDPADVLTPSRILRIVDEYDELLSGHQTGNPMPIRLALQSLYLQGKKGVLDGELVAAFINLIGIYPTYSLLELSTGERGIVTANSRENLLQPTILLIQDAAHQPLADPIPFNLSVLSSHEPPPEIVQVLSPNKKGIQLEEVLEGWLTL